VPTSIAPDQALSRRLAEVRFRRLYAEHGRAILAYALRRVSDPEDAADVVADTFLVAWRRSVEVPAGSGARLWLFGVARRTIANQRRGENRRTRLAERLRSDLAAADLQTLPSEQGDEEVLSALARLDPADQEILRLTTWEELTPAQAGRVLGLSSVAARSRLHRARRRLRRELTEAAPNFNATASLEREEER
jgi:RNA polymerase sigma-70 factor (ECF subfamily)